MSASTLWLQQRLPQLRQLWSEQLWPELKWRRGGLKLLREQAQVKQAQLLKRRLAQHCRHGGLLHGRRKLRVGRVQPLREGL